MDLRITTLHPDPNKRGVTIARHKYDAARTALLETLAAEGPLGLNDLLSRAEARMDPSFVGSPSWYLMAAKLDLEARDEIACDRRPSRQVLSLPGGPRRR